MQIIVKFFSTLKFIIGVDEVTLDIPQGSSVAELLNMLCTKYGFSPQLTDNIFAIIGQTNSPREQIIKDGDTVLLLHHLGGG